MKFEKYLVLSIVFILLHISCGAVKSPNKVVLTGTVRDNSTLCPVSGAVIRLSNLEAETITDINGQFSLSLSVSHLQLGTIDTLTVDNDKYWRKETVVKLYGETEKEILLNAQKHRLIVTTDIGGTDPDDEQSMVHLMVSANDIDIEAIICGLTWLEGKLGTGVVNSIIDAYDEDYPNLIIHDADYPTPAYLRSITKPGQPISKMAGVGEGKDSPGSELIISAIDNDDPRPVWLNAWGGANTIAQALWKVKNTRSSEEVDKFINKIRIYDILGQDDAGAWIAKTFPDLIYIRNKEIYGWGPSDEWVKENVQSKGALGTKYPNRIWATEGDSPAFMHLMAKGLNNPDKIDSGGWGGRFGLTKVANIRGMDIAQRSGVDESLYDPYFMFTNTSEGNESINRWKQHIWNNLSAKMTWTVTSTCDDANHHPIAIIGKDSTMQIIYLSAESGSKVSLDAGMSYDPDGDNLTYNWCFYQEPSSYKGLVSIDNNKSSHLDLLIPLDDSGKNIHIILELTDSGFPYLTTYRRVVIDVN